MAHHIGKDDKVLAVRQPTWHRLEELLAEAPTAEEARKLVHNYTVAREPLYRKVIWMNDTFDSENPTVEEFFELVPEFELNVRSDTRRDFSVVPTDRPEVQPAQVYEVVEALQKSEPNMLIETAGTFKEGAHMFVLLKLDEPIEIKGDKQGASIPFYCLQNAFVPGFAFRGLGTGVRVVCWNTSTLADMIAEAEGMSFNFTHVGDMNDKIEEALAALAGWREGLQQWKLAKEDLASIKVTTEQTDWFINQFIQAPPGQLITDQVKANIEAAQVDFIYELYGGMNAGIEGTALGLFEAASSYNEHVRAAASPITRFKRSMISPSKILFEAQDLARQAALA